MHIYSMCEFVRFSAFARCCISSGDAYRSGSILCRLANMCHKIFSCRIIIVTLQMYCAYAQALFENIN